ALFWLEALVGPDPVWKGVLAELEARGDDLLSNGRADFGKTIYNVGFLLYRLPSATAEAARKKLESLYVELANPNKPPLEHPAPVRFLDVVLHGAAGSERSGHRYGKGVLSPYFLGHVLDD